MNKFSLANSDRLTDLVGKLVYLTLPNSFCGQTIELCHVVNVREKTLEVEFDGKTKRIPRKNILEIHPFNSIL